MGPLFSLAVVGIIGVVAPCCAMKEEALGNFEEKKTVARGLRKKISLGKVLCGEFGQSENI